LPALGVVYRARCGWWRSSNGSRGCDVLAAFKIGNRTQELSAMPERRDTNLFEILIGQVTQNIEINIILGKALSVLPEAKFFEPVRNWLHRWPSWDPALSVMDGMSRSLPTLAQIE
jgi:hypothetical protein